MKEQRKWRVTKHCSYRYRQRIAKGRKKRQSVIKKILQGLDRSVLFDPPTYYKAKAKSKHRRVDSSFRYDPVDQAVYVMEGTGKALTCFKHNPKQHGAAPVDLPAYENSGN